MPQNFTVPQYIDVESKIIGALTVRQFMICLAAAIIIGLFYRFASFLTFVIVSPILFIVAVVFAFIKINGRPFHFFVLNFIQTSMLPNLRVWDHKNSYKDLEEFEVEEEVKDKEEPIPEKPRLSSSRLNELSLTVDTKGVYREDS